MLKLETKLEGQVASFGVVSNCIEELGYHLGGNWDYENGCFDHILCQEGGESIYIRIPFIALVGEIDNFNATIRFGTPYVIKHVVNIGLDSEGSSLLDATGFSQFQKPLDKDGKIVDKNRWIHAGEVAVENLLDCMQKENVLNVS